MTFAVSVMISTLVFASSAVKMPVGASVPEPVAWAEPSRRSRASANIIRISLARPGMSAAASKLACTNACALCTGMLGWAKVGESSLTSVSWASKLAVTPAEVMPCQEVSPGLVSVTTRLICRMALDVPELDRMTVGSRWVGTR